MKKFANVLGAATLALSLAACGGQAGTEAAASSDSITGTWQLNLDSAKWENASSTYTFADGEYTCGSCLPPYTIKADGEWQSVDRPGVDELKYTLVDDQTVQTASRFEGKDLGNSTWTVSEDGTTMTIDWTNLDGEEDVTGQSVLTRVAAGPENSHAASGEWAPEKVSNISDSGMSVAYSLEGDTLSFDGNGSSWSATLGGEAVAIEGANDGSMVAAERTGDNSFKQTYTRDGEVTGVTEMTVDGDTVSVVSIDPRDGSSVTWNATRQ
jgi:hypothetical protein